MSCSALAGVNRETLEGLPNQSQQNAVSNNRQCDPVVDNEARRFWTMHIHMYSAWPLPRPRPSPSIIAIKHVLFCRLVTGCPLALLQLLVAAVFSGRPFQEARR